MVEKNYMKIFAVGVILFIVGIVLVMSYNLYYINEETHDSDFWDSYYTLTTLSVFFIQLGMLFFALSTFMGAVIDESLSPVVRAGCVLASSVAIIGLALIIVFG